MPIRTTPMPPLTEDDAAWFWSHVDVRGPDECWLVHEDFGSRDRQGYVRVHRHGRTLLAHRLAVALDGRDPGDGLVCHECDTPGCCSIFHLVVGDAALNAQHREARGRRRPPRGEASSSARLTQREAEAIRRMHGRGVHAGVIAESFGISRSTAYAVISGKAYKSEDEEAAA